MATQTYRNAFLGIFLSFILVGFGQPSWSMLCSILAASFGYGIFWFSIFPFSRKNRALVALFWFTCVELIHLSWMSSSHYHGIYIWFVYVGIVFWLGMQFAFFTFLLPEKGPIKPLTCLALASLWTIIEWGRLFLFCGFAFNPAGLALTSNVYTLQMASIAGIFGLSFWIMLTNFFSFNFVFNKRKKELFPWFFLTVIPYLFGFIHVMYHDFFKEKTPFQSLEVALVQTGLKPEQKVPYLSRISAFKAPLKQWQDIFVYLNERKNHHLDLVVLPEAALPFEASLPFFPLEDVKKLFYQHFGPISETAFPQNYTYQDPETYSFFVNHLFIAQTLANLLQAELVIGFDDMPHLENASYNAAFHFIPGKQTIARYEKQVLVPLAEYLPLSFLKPLVEKYGITHFFSPGKGPKIFRGKALISPSICYEECYGYIIRKGRKKGAHLFINMTNDNYYPFSKLPFQHFDHGKIRAVENGVPLLRACNTGITAGIDALGRTIIKLGEGKNVEWIQGALFLSLPIYHFFTPYVFWGDFFIISLCFALIALKCIQSRHKLSLKLILAQKK